MDLLTQFPWLIYLLAMLGGTIAGFINTLAGSGSLITLPILIFLGLPANEANATNRVGILFQSMVGVFKFRQSGKLPWGNGQFLILPTTLGALVGAFIAIDLNEQWMNYTIATVMFCMLGVIVLKPEKWLKEHTELMANYRGIGNFALFFVIGLYGGFIQAGVGVFLLIAMVARCGFSMVNANAIKLVLVLIFTIPATAVFIYYDQINWLLGGIMAAGQGLGAWIAAQYAIGNQHAALWTRRLLITVIILSIIKLLWG
ncbi:MAG: putative membrane protein YfcA [Phenylobacterium sp.]|jgi:uncharacterized membrane protein YfcA